MSDALCLECDGEINPQSDGSGECACGTLYTPSYMTLASEAAAAQRSLTRTLRQVEEAVEWWGFEVLYGPEGTVTVVRKAIG